MFRENRRAGHRKIPAKRLHWEAVEAAMGSATTAVLPVSELNEAGG
jgi:hypothetical protein